MTSHAAVRGRDHFGAYVTTETKVASVQALHAIRCFFFHDLLLACDFEKNCHNLFPDNPYLSRTSTATFFLVFFTIIVQVVKFFCRKRPDCECRRLSPSSCWMVVLSFLRCGHSTSGKSSTEYVSRSSSTSVCSSSTPPPPPPPLRVFPMACASGKSSTIALDTSPSLHGGSLFCQHLP